MDIFNANSVLYLISNLFGIYVRIRFIGVFFDRTCANKKSEFMWLLLFYLINSSLHLLFSSPIINLVTNLLFFFCITFLYQGKFWKRLLSTALIYAVSMLVDSITYNTFIKLALRFSLKDATNVISNLFLFSLVLILEKIFSGIKAPKMNLTHWLAIILVPIGSIVITALIFLSDLNIYSTIIIVLILLVINVLIFYIYDVLIRYYENKHEKDFLIQQNKAYKNQFKIINESRNNLRRLRHDMKNHIYAMQIMVENKKFDELSYYLRQALETLQSKKEYVNSGHLEVDSILNYKLFAAETAGAVLDLTVKIPDIIEIKSFDLNVILGNLLDNAIEALEKNTKKNLKIDIELERAILYVTIANSCNKNLSPKLATTKTDKQNHGIGLESVNAIVQKYDGKMNVSHKNGVFTVSLMLYTRG